MANWACRIAREGQKLGKNKLAEQKFRTAEMTAIYGEGRLANSERFESHCGFLACFNKVPARTGSFVYCNANRTF